MSRFGALEFEDLEPVGPGTPSGRYLRLFWQPVMRLKDLPPGRARPLEMLGEKFTIYRGEDGTPHVTDFRCAHRGTPLSLGWVEGESIRCRYHGWRFDAAGRCVEQPNEDRPFCDKVRMRAYPTREYAGLVFAYFGEGAPPPFRTYPDLDRPGVLVADPVEVLPCGFWNRFDNDHGHRHWVHRATALRRNRPDILVLHHEAAEGTPYGWRGVRLLKGDGADAETSLGEIVKGGRESAKPRWASPGTPTGSCPMPACCSSAPGPRVSRGAATCGTPSWYGPCRSTTAPMPPSTSLIRRSKAPRPRLMPGAAASSRRPRRRPAGTSPRPCSRAR